MAKYIPSSNILNSAVVNDKGQALGKIDHLLVDLDTGRVEAAVMTYGGFPNRTKHLAIPWDLFTYSAHDKKFILNIPKEVLDKARGYDNLADVSGLTDYYWLGDTYAYYGRQPEWDKKRKEEIQRDLDASKRRREEIALAQSTKPVEPNPPA